MTRRRLLRPLPILLALCLAFAVAVVVMAGPHVSWARLPARASVLPAYSTIYLVPAQVGGIDILFGPIALPAPKSDADWQRLEAETATALALRNGAAAAFVGAVALAPALLLGLVAGLLRLRRHRSRT
ncbi:hypothetical protein L2U69_00855 [Zavarzinia compransoris]|uniref:hypothetical protein n=1 Tax=Zavarzinia marina TaxID=2911065 RepID=UPI001F32275B|nr:hypothetical protein [Zavarzinia marina]MCF4164191.1 hypothetical protein [Zavarzinia marina]